VRGLTAEDTPRYIASLFTPTRPHAGTGLKSISEFD
jgi:hypothetical protein